MTLVTKAISSMELGEAVKELVGCHQAVCALQASIEVGQH